MSVLKKKFNFKKFMKKYKMVFITAALLVVFIIGSVLIGDAAMDKEVQEWLDQTQKKQYVVTVIARTTCGYCNAFKPTMQEVQEENGFLLYWIDRDLYTPSARNQLESAYKINNHGFDGTPYTFVTYDGEFKGYLSGNKSKEDLVAFLQNLGVIEKTEETPTE